MIVFVVALHSAVTYSGVGSWYYVDPHRPGKVSMLFFALFQSHLQAFFMGLLFLIAGYFVPTSYDRKGAGRFVADRAYRLGVPTLIFAMFLQPSIALLRSRLLGEPITASLSGYWGYLFSTSFLSGTGPMWFALALLIFSIIYAGVRLMGIHASTSDRVPTHLQVFGLFALMSIGSFLVRIIQPIGTNVWNMQLGFFTQYILLFYLGVIARRHDWFNRIPIRFAMPWVLAVVLIGPVLWSITIIGVVRSGNPETLAGGVHWQSAGYATWESLFCVGACLGFLTIFREYVNRQGPFAHFMSNNAFAVYVFHAPILVVLAVLMRNWSEYPFEKFLMLSAMGLVVTFLFANYVVRYTPGLRDVMR
jgi:glucan biosynthesis protein C